MIKLLFISCIRGYQYIISPMLRTNCRFMPSCSEYSITAFKKYNVITGGFLTVKRLLSCHPFGRHGVDMVPENFSLKQAIRLSLQRFTQ